MSWYHATMYDAGRPAGSLWEETAPALADGADLGPNGDDVCDIAIIGGGFTGLPARCILRAISEPMCVFWKRVRSVGVRRAATVASAFFNRLASPAKA